VRARVIVPEGHPKRDGLTLIDVFSAMIGLEVGSLTCQVTDGRCDANAECLGGLDVAPRRGFVDAGIRG
jgi:hypothetical protein